MKLFTTVKKVAHIEQTIEKSKFIAHISPAKSREEADEFIDAIRKEYRDATHNVPAIVIGEKMQIQWGSDDGEPQGTSGAPIVQMLVASGITNVCVVVTRYFGGIKLGPGGLVRAYTSSAKLAIDEAGICDCVEKILLTFSMDYSFLAKLQNIAGNDFKIENVEYLDQVKVSISTTPEQLEKVKTSIANLTGGKALFVEEKNCEIYE